MNMNMNIFTILWTSLATIFTTLPTVFIKKYIESNQLYWIILLFLSLIVSLFSTYKLLISQNNATIVFSFIRALSILFMTFIGVIYLHDEFTISTTTGIILLLMSIYLLS